MANQADFLVIDGITINVGVLSGIKEDADILDRYANRTQDGVLHRDVIGTYYNYSNIKFANQNDENYSDYETLWNILSEPKEFHLIKIGNFTFKAYIAKASREIETFKNGRAYHKNMQCKFTAERPART